MSHKNLKYWIGLSGWPGLGWKKLEWLLKHLGSVEKIWQTGAKLNPNWQQRDLNQELEELNKRLIKVITIEDKNYPKLLKQIDSPPFVLYIRGSVEVLSEPSLAVVGTRKPTSYGLEASRKLVTVLAQKLVIVSGLARGIDSAAHRQCLKQRGRTVAVLGHGLEKTYPVENTRLAEEIVNCGGCLVTEFPLNSPMAKINFPLRNRIIAGLTLGTLVIEGGEISGTKITANMAADFGREVFCVAGRLGEPQAKAPAELIQQGAKLVTGPEDILEEFRQYMV